MLKEISFISLRISCSLADQRRCIRVVRNNGSTHQCIMDNMTYQRFCALLDRVLYESER